MRDAYHSQVNTGDRSNPFHAPPVATLASIQAVANSELYKKVLQPKGFTETDPQLILEATVDAVKAKVISPDKAAEDYALLFKSAIQFNNKSYGGLTTSGFAPQSQYNTLITRETTPFEAGANLASTALKIVTTPDIIVPGYKAAKDFLFGETPEASLVPARRTEVVDVADPVKIREVFIKYLNAQQTAGK